MATKKIDKLTPEQEALLPVYRDKWIKIGLSTEPCDRPACEAAVKLAYEKAGVKPPSRVVWLRSPLAGAIAADMLANDDKPKNKKDFENFIKDEKMCLQGISKATITRAANQIGNACYGSHDANWLAFYDYFHKVCNVTEIDQLEGVFGMAGCGWWWPFEDVAILTERPMAIHQDTRNRLHNPTGPAISYSDGFELYAIHGILVDPDVINKPITINQIEKERNAEVRRILIERYGISKYLIDSKSEVLDKSNNGILYRKRLAGDEDLVMVRVLNTTPEPDGTLTRDEAIAVFGPSAKCVVGDFNAPLSKAPKSARFKEYSIRVPPTVTTAKAAVAWTFGLSENEYDPEFES